LEASTELQQQRIGEGSEQSGDDEPVVACVRLLHQQRDFDRQRMTPDFFLAIAFGSGSPMRMRNRPGSLSAPCRPDLRGSRGVSQRRCAPHPRFELKGHRIARLKDVGFAVTGEGSGACSGWRLPRCRGRGIAESLRQFASRLRRSTGYLARQSWTINSS